jgi:outer membrane protein TolC
MIIPLRNGFHFVGYGVFLLCVSLSTAFGQTPALSSEKPFTIDDLYGLVLNYHPVARQANLLSDEARQQLRIARGNFDPKVELAYDRKQFNDNVYWDDWAFALKVPLWSNTDLKLSHYTAEGVYLNPRENFPSRGLTGIGIEIPVGRGLFIDERRAMLRQAQIFQDLNEAERIGMLNDLLLNAALDYYTWSFVYNRQLVLENGVQLARQRYRLVRSNVVQGAEAPVDSVEAKITLQAREIEARKGRLELETMGLKLSTYLWNPEGEPLIWSQEVYPPPFNIQPELEPIDIENLRNLALENHPELQGLRLKQNILEFDFRLARENLKPELNLQYEYLFPGRGLMEGLRDAQWVENYKIGAGIQIPLFLRKERGKYELTKIKLQSNQLKIDGSSYKIQVEVDNQANYLQTYLELSLTYFDLVNNSQRLLAVENLKFENGESTLFLVNQRELSLLSNQEKQLDALATLEMNRIRLLWAAGIPYLGNTPMDE